MTAYSAIECYLFYGRRIGGYFGARPFGETISTTTTEKIERPVE